MKSAIMVACGIDVTEILQYIFWHTEILHSALTTTSNQVPLLNDIIRTLIQIILRKIAGFNPGTSKK